MSAWPDGVARIPADDWVGRPPEELARNYDTVREHGWYRNLDLTVETLRDRLGDGDVLLDYSGGTGILAGRLLAEVGDRDVGVLIVDASPKFLRVALEQLGGDERVAFRLIRYLKQERRLETLQEVVGEPLLERGVDLLTSTNAIHLYYDLDVTLRSWHDLLVPGGPAFVQSGNIGVDELPEGAWIIDETVDAINDAAVGLVREDDRFAPYREGLADPRRVAAYEELRCKFFLPVRPLEHYMRALKGAGFRIRDVSHVPIEARTDEWSEFLAAYHEGVLGWVGGSERIEGVPPEDAAVADRLTLLRESVARVFGGPTFSAVWTYVDAVRA
jgi:SAM-dependent methyltransferase